VGTDLVDKDLFAAHFPRLFIALAKRGHIVTWITGRASPEYRFETFEPPRFKVEALTQTRTVRYFSELIRKLFGFWNVLRSAAHRDVIIFENVRSPVSLATPILLLERFVNRRPIVLLRITTNPQETGSGLREFILRFEDALSVKLAATFFDGIFFISPMMAQMYASKFRIPQNKIGIWPVAVDSAFFAKQPKSKIEKLRRELDSNELLVIYHGYLSEARNLMTTAQAFELLKSESIKAKLILLGEGPIKEKLVKYISAHRLNDCVQLLGPVDYLTVPQYIAACDVGIIPLPDHEWFRYQCPTKLLEYLAMGKPVIVSNIPANSWVASRASVAIFLDGTSSDEIADGVKRFIASRKDLSPEEGRQIAKAFSIEQMAENIELQILAFGGKS